MWGHIKVYVCMAYKQQQLKHIEEYKNAKTTRKGHYVLRRHKCEKRTHSDSVQLNAFLNKSACSLAIQKYSRCVDYNTQFVALSSVKLFGHY